MVSTQHVGPNKVINVQGNSKFKSGTTTDTNKCSITGIFEMSNENLVISDVNNWCVKLLDPAYNVKGQLKLTTYPWSICGISPNEVAVTISDCKSLNEIHFLQVDTGKLITIKHMQLSHRCYGIAHNKGDMFVTSDTALLHYTTDGRLVKKLYEDKSSFFSGNAAI
ncbi:hypothetical protein DPMN_167550 [Dreissena polymorpha]|uniref:Uncharacterized protein n=1 Tax=Dreissena polymorpha TaxID=45954 RepID=A0A9D4F031_DREPO|nr:hypothetical protein DPMN_167550 [Dreissena polymorpha]